MSASMNLHSGKYTPLARVVRPTDGRAPYIEFRVEGDDGSAVTLFIADPAQAQDIAAVLTDHAAQLHSLAVCT